MMSGSGTDDYQVNNRVVRLAIREALEQQGNKVSLKKVQAYLLEALGVNVIGSDFVGVAVGEEASSRVTMTV